MKKIIAVLTVILSLTFGTIISSAAENPNVVLVNPASNSTVNSSNLLISAKLTQPTRIKVYVYEEKQIVNGTLSAVNVNTLTTSNGAVSESSFTPVLVTASAIFTSNNNLTFYTKQVNNLKPGLYKIQIDTLDAAGKEAIYTNSSHVAIKEKTEDDTKIFETPQSGTMQFLQNLLKTIFGD